MKKFWLVDLLRKIHKSEDGTISIETILIIGAIAMPILIYLIMKGWPKVKEYFTKGLEDLEENRETAVQ
jgi:hypothetical protein